MKALLLYRPNSEHSTMVEDYLRDFKVQTGKTLETLDVDSPEGIELCKVHEIMEYPAVLVTDDDGHQLNLWTGTQLPRFGEVSYYVNDAGASRV
jgi:hypothetical protein